MIIFEDLTAQVRTAYPNEDWTDGQAKYVIEDESPLYHKYFNIPYKKFVEDEEGNLIDIVAVDPPELPEPGPPEEYTPAQKREWCYENLLLIEWRGDIIAVDTANKIWLAYEAEGLSEVADEISPVIHAAKEEIRAKYPDKGVI